MKRNLIMCILEILTDLCLTRQRIEIKFLFLRCCLQCFSSEQVSTEHRENCLVINGKQSVRLKGGTISFKNYFKQLLVPFKIYADFESILKKVECNSVKNDSSYARKYQDHTLCGFAYQVVCIDNKFSKKVVLYRGKDAVYQFIKTILSEYSYCKKVARKHFNKNLVMSAEEKEILQLSNICWICDRLFDVGDEKVRDHYSHDWKI